MQSKILFFSLISLIVVLNSSCIVKPFAGAYRYDPEDMNKNLSPKARLFMEEQLKDIKSDDLHDYHMHIVGNSHDHGTSVNPKKFKWHHPIQKIVLESIRSGAGVQDFKTMDKEYLERLIKLIRHSPIKMKYHILAFDHLYHENGEIDKAESEFYVSNERVFQLSKQYPDIFIPTISVHPYRKDALEELEKWAKKGCRMIKWLPNAQGMDPANPSLDPYYKMMLKYDMALLSHSGREHAVSERFQEFANPLRFRRPLDLGVKVILAHCAGLGSYNDYDNPGKKEKSFNLFLRLMDDKKYEENLFGEISTMTLFTRLPVPIAKIIERKDLHHRIINGSDYPVPSLNILIQTARLTDYGFIKKEERKYLNEIYNYNPLVFDFILKRAMRAPGTKQKLAKTVFAKHDKL